MTFSKIGLKSMKRKCKLLDKFVDYLLGSNKEPYEIRNLITYYVAVAWDCSYIQKRNDIEKMEEANEL